MQSKLSLCDHMFEKAPCWCLIIVCTKHIIHEVLIISSFYFASLEQAYWVILAVTFGDQLGQWLPRRSLGKGELLYHWLWGTGLFVHLRWRWGHVYFACWNNGSLLYAVMGSFWCTVCQSSYIFSSNVFMLCDHHNIAFLVPPVSYLILLKSLAS